jgi:hypothetical protein
MSLFKFLLVMLMLHLWSNSGVCSTLNVVLGDSTFDKNYISKSCYFSLTISNDIYHGTDWYYTGGIKIEYVTQSLHNSPLKFLLLSFPRNAVNEYGISLTIDAFTPVDIKQKEIMEKDRPYAGYIMAGHFVISTQAANSRRLTSRLNMGIIGPESQTKDIQKGLHALLQCAQPQGWNNQIKRDVLIDYSLQVEKAIFPFTKNIEMIAQGSVRVGTLYNNIGLGGKIRIGKMNGYFNSFPPSIVPGKPLYITQKVRLFGYVQINTKLNAYNATLQGGLFNKDSPHVVEQQQVERAVTEWKSGLVCGYENISIEIGQTNLTREFKAGEPHSWGYVTLTILL